MSCMACFCFRTLDCDVLWMARYKTKRSHFQSAVHRNKKLSKLSALTISDSILRYCCSYLSCADQVHVAVTEMLSLFPQVSLLIQHVQFLLIITKIINLWYLLNLTVKITAVAVTVQMTTEVVILCKSSRRMSDALQLSAYWLYSAEVTNNIKLLVSSDWK